MRLNSSKTQLALVMGILCVCAVAVSSLKLDKKTALLGKPVDQVYQSFNPMWFNTGFGCQDVGIGPEGGAYVVGTDQKLYHYNFLENMYTLVEGDKEIPSIARVSVDADDTPYVVTSCGQVYYLNYYNYWVQLPGCGTDIGVGRGGDVWKIGCDARQGGFGIWKLFCKCTECKSSCERNVYRWRPMHYLANVQGDRRKCFWYRIEGGAVRVGVHPDGNPWVLTNDGVVYGYDGVNWLRVNGILGRDVTVSNEGMVMVAGVNAKIYALQNPANNLWVQIAGSALDIAAGPLTLPWVCGNDHLVYTTAKAGYN